MNGENKKSLSSKFALVTYEKHIFSEKCMLPLKHKSIFIYQCYVRHLKTFDLIQWHQMSAIVLMCTTGVRIWGPWNPSDAYLLLWPSNPIVMPNDMSNKVEWCLMMPLLKQVIYQLCENESQLEHFVLQQML